jgi:hypothetical protein
LGLQYALFDASHFHFYVCILISGTYETEEDLPYNKFVELQSKALKTVAGVRSRKPAQQADMPP